MLHKSTIAILGGSGFIGTHLVSRLKDRGLNVRIGDLVPSQTFPGLSTTCDVRAGGSLNSILIQADSIINLAAEHRDDIQPISRYYDTNVKGAEQVCDAARIANVRIIIFTSSAAVYGFHPLPVDETGPFNPFNSYGKTKFLAEQIYKTWADEDPSRSLVIIRPTVVFGEGNRGNVYNLLRQIASGKFLMIGPGTNKKSMAYVGNIAELLIHSLTMGPGTHIFNYVDTPDLTMMELVHLVNQSLNRLEAKNWSVPQSIAIAGGHVLDAVSWVTGVSFPVSAIRVRKFCENTQFSATKILATGFKPQFTLLDAINRTVRSEFGS